MSMMLIAVVVEDVWVDIVEGKGLGGGCDINFGYQEIRDTKSAPFTRLRGIHDRRGRYTTGRTSATRKKKMRNRSCHEEEVTTIKLRKKTISARGRSVDDLTGKSKQMLPRKELALIPIDANREVFLEIN
ncbi:hypothetical protein ACMD2_22855 [Ananas comosus]|uniref:Uncharacterized protein n=1 Tax=Ananas comosus TaxID=4615 RepID=A0A199VYW0_ANACO|nr:hypothetical protein ACMD2_22855 [Ananas comosus]